ncbi:MAG: iron ABC transporter permease [Chloroflexi bacterium]|nr:iron ABC transporter permease [Chloroflexota bacterium]
MPQLFSRWRRVDLWLIGAVGLGILFVLLFIIYPLFQVISISVYDEGHLTLKPWQEMLALRNWWVPLWNTILLATIVGITSTLTGFIFAYAMQRVALPFKGLFRALAILPIITPPFLLALAAILLFGRNGLITAGLFGVRTSAIFGLPGLVLTQTLSEMPVAFLVLAGMLGSLDTSLEEASATMGATPRQTFFRVIWPLMRPGLANSFLLAFISSVADFGNPMVIGGDYSVLSTAIYMRITGLYDPPGAAVLSVVLLVPSLIAFYLQSQWVGKRSYVTITGKSSGRSRPWNDKLISSGATFVVILWAMTTILLYGSILVGSFANVWGVDYTLTLRHYLFIENLGFEPYINSLILAVVSAPLTALIGLLMAYIFVRRPFPGRWLLEFGAMLSFAVPGTIIGVGYILAFNAPPLVLTGTATIIIISFIFRNMPVGIRAGIAALSQIDPSLEEASAVMGARLPTTLRRVVVPLIIPAIFSGLVFSFVRAITAISAVIFLVSPRWKLVTPAILAEINQGRFGVAAAYSTIVVVTMITAILIAYRVSRQMGTTLELQA